MKKQRKHKLPHLQSRLQKKLKFVKKKNIFDLFWGPEHDPKSEKPKIVNDTEGVIFRKFSTFAKY